MFSSLFEKWPGASRVVLWSLFVHILTLHSSGFVVLGTISSTGTDVTYISFVLSIVQGLCYLMYPLAGLLADIYWTRIKAMFYGTYLQVVGVMFLLVVTVILIINNDFVHRWYLWLIIVALYGIIQLGLALFESNAIQFGTDQMPEASSSQLSAFVHWYFWSIFIGYSLLCLLNVFEKYRSYLSLLIAILLQLMCSLLAISTIKLSVKHFEIEPAGKNPTKVILNVTGYAIRHSTPQNRSAFTYGDEQTSRLDYAKCRYGDPFSTEEVENVKSFFRICLVLVSLSGFWLTDETVTTSSHIKGVTTNVTTSSSSWFTFITLDIFGVSNLIILLRIQFYQLILRRVAKRYTISMLKKMFIGLICVLMAVLFLQVIEVLIAEIHPHVKCPFFTDNLFHKNASLTISLLNYNYLIIPQVFNGFSFLLVFLTVMEFILAQAPRDMQGFLIGIWYSIECITLLISAVESIPEVNCWGYILSIKAVIMITMLVFYIVVAFRYKHRTREEATDVNNHAIIEEYCERHIKESETNERRSFIEYEVYENTNYGGTYIIL